MNYFIFTITAFILLACVTLKGNYDVKAVDANGNQLNRVAMTATGSGIYTARNSLCATYSKAKIIIMDMQTRQELSGESQYQCK